MKRILTFIVNGQMLSKSGDFENITAGSCGYLFASFNFSPEWRNMRKVATFTAGGEDYHVPLQVDACMIPADALKYNSIDVTVEGRSENNCSVRTTGVRITQTGGIK